MGRKLQAPGRIGGLFKEAAGASDAFRVMSGSDFKTVPW